MTMTISNYEGAADTFTWSHNPNVFDDVTGSNYEMTNLPFQRNHIVVSGGGIPPKEIVLTGFFEGTNADTNYRALSKHFQQNNQLKKLYWESDKFFLGIGKNIKRTRTGQRPGIWDYVANFQTVIGILLGDTARTSGTNTGNVTSYVEKISGTVTDGSNPVVCSDALGNEITIPATALTTGQAIVIQLVSMVDTGDGIYVSRYNYATIAGSETSQVKVTDGFGLLQIAAAANVSTISTTNLTNPVVTFRDGWSA